ncbi:MAG: hypothetical protein ACOX7P_03185 [Oscillospiraceae bacterium]|jgi:hypothetical protein
MGKNRITVIAVTGALTIAIIILGIIYFTYMRRSTPEVVLPTPLPTGSGAGTGTNENSENGDELIISVTPDTVQEIVAAMKRPSCYYQSIGVETYWPGGSRLDKAQLWTDNGLSRIDFAGGDGREYSILRRGDGVFLLQSGNEAIQIADGYFSIDDDMMIYTYEDLCTLPSGTIKQAAQTDLNGMSCIYAEAEENGRLMRFWISAFDGLLVQAEVLENGEKVYCMETYELSISGLDSSVFILPGVSEAEQENQAYNN